MFDLAKSRMARRFLGDGDAAATAVRRTIARIKNFLIYVTFKYSPQRTQRSQRGKG